MSTSPEQAAVQATMNQNNGNSGTMLDPNSVQVLQTTVLDERTYVLIAYEGVRSDLGGAKSTCLSLFEMRKAMLGMWSPSSSGGSCESQINISGESPEAPPQPISIGGGRASGDGKNDIGTSTASGRVFDDTIKTIQVTWLDGTSQQVDVVNASYVIARKGQVDMVKIEALDEKGNVVFTWQPATGPGKK